MTKLTRPISRATLGTLDGSFGTDSERRVIITLIPGNGDDRPDMLELRPERTRRPERIAVIDAYRYALRCRVNRDQLDKARARKDAKAARLARAKQERAEKRLIHRP